LNIVEIRFDQIQYKRIVAESRRWGEGREETSALHVSFYSDMSAPERTAGIGECVPCS
jgi:hypothetical protein